MSYLFNSFLVKNKQERIVKGIVSNVEEREYSNKITVKSIFNTYIIYDNSFTKVDIGDEIKAIGEPNEITSNYNDNEFDYQKYCQSKRIVNIIRAEEITINKGFNIYYLRRILYKYLDSVFDKTSISFIKGFVFCDTKSFDERIKNDIEINGISHLFAISGLHISLLVSLLSKVLSLMGLKEEKYEKIIIGFLIVYLFITYFAVSIMRAAFMYIFGVMNKRYKLRISSLDIISIVFVLFIITNPYIMYDLSFVLSFCASFFIILVSDALNKIKMNVRINQVYELIILTLSVQIFTLPITINLSNSYNLLSPITNIFFITIVTSIILPFTFLTLLFSPILKYLYCYMITSFSSLIEIFAKYISININLPSFNYLEITIFYILLVLFFLNKKKVIVCTTMFLFFFIYYNKAYLNIEGEIFFLALSEGDCTIINYPLNKGIIVIDTGTDTNDEAYNFLKAKGIRKIDYLVLTHNHRDHNGGAKKIIDNINVTNIVIGPYDNSEYRYYKQSHIMKKGDSFTIAGSKYIIYGPNDKEENENANSLILYGNIGKHNYLFLGDTTKEVEETLIPYNLKVDVVKVGHHGSPTSTSPLLYKAIKPQYAIIETGRVKYFNFPNPSVIDILKESIIYRTDINYQIKIKFTKNKSIISSLR